MLAIGWTYAVLGAALIGLCAITPPASTANSTAYSLIGVLATTAVLVGAARYRPDRRTAWTCITAGQSAWVLGNVFYLGLLPLPQADGQHVGNILYLLGNVIVVAAMWQMMFHRCRGARLASSLDATMLVTGMALAVWVLVGRPVLTGALPASGDVNLGLAFVLFDITIAASAWAVLTTPGARTPAFFLLIGAVGLQLAGDSSYLTPTLNDTLGAYAASLAWMVSTLLWGAAALHPSMRSLTAPGTADATGLTRSRLVVLLLAVLAGPLAAYAEAGTVDARDPVVLAASVLLVILTVARMALALRTTVSALRTTEALRDAMAHQARHDGLTDLVNRNEMHRQLQQALQAAHRRSCARAGGTVSCAERGGDAHGLAEESSGAGLAPGVGVGVVLIDLDGFKQINDTLGHAAGDAALQEVARRLRASTRAGQDCAARLGGDEFVVVFTEVVSPDDVAAAAQRLLDGITAPTSWHGHTLHVGASIGAAFTRHGTAEVLLAEADSATYRAKAEGGDRVVLFDDAARAGAEAHASIERSLRRLLQHSPYSTSADQKGEGTLELHHQPVVDLATGEQHGVEALIRWRCTDGALVPPDAFIPIAEASDLICEVGRWVLQTACTQLASWADVDQRQDWRMAVNISARHLKHPSVVREVVGALQSTGARAEQLTVEVTETVLVDSPSVIEHLRQLRALGVQVAIDDFGTGYTSINQLQHLPADYLKIDRSLVAADDPASADLVRLLVRAATAFGLTVIGEGVEHEDQHRALLQAGAQLGQGWLFGRPQLPDPPTPVRSTSAVMDGR